RATLCSSFFTALPTTQLYTLSLHDALPILRIAPLSIRPSGGAGARSWLRLVHDRVELSEGQREHVGFGEREPSGVAWVELVAQRSEEHTSELQSPCNLVCRLLLEKKKSTH